MTPKSVTNVRMRKHNSRYRRRTNRTSGEQQQQIEIEKEMFVFSLKAEKERKKNVRARKIFIILERVAFVICDDVCALFFLLRFRFQFLFSVRIFVFSLVLFLPVRVYTNKLKTKPLNCRAIWFLYATEWCESF